MENRRNERPIVAIDAEGDAGDTGLLGVAYFDGESGFYITDKESNYDCLFDYANSGYDFVAHNAQYDLAVIFWQLDIDAQAIFYNQRFNHGRWFYNKEKPAARIWDTLSISAFLSLAKVGEGIGIKKLPTPYSLLENGRNGDRWICKRHLIWECVECYAIRDAEICYAYFNYYKSLLSEYSVAPKHTLGSAAISIWKKTDPNQSDYIRSKSLAEFIRQSYHGGRTEPYKYGHVNTVYTADVQSMYPYIMATKPMPDTHNLKYIDHEHDDISLLQYEGVSECLVKHPPAYIPTLPLYLESKLLFPVGIFRGVFNHCELRAAIARGTEILTLYRTAYTPTLCEPFKNFISQLIAYRLELKAKKDPRELVVKIILNSLYGRMGLKPGQEQSTYIRWDGKKPLSDFKGYDIDIQPFGIFLNKTIERNQVSHDANILWATYTTACARLRLLEFMELQGENLVYCDTDSIYSLSPILGSSEGFGNLNPEETFDRGYFKGPKLYRLERSDGDNKTRARGVPKQYADIFLDYGYAEFSSPLTVKEALRQRKNAGEWVMMHRTQKFTYSKRQILNPSILFEGKGYSDTIPLFIGSDGDIFGEW